MRGGASKVRQATAFSRREGLKLVGGGFLAAFLPVFSSYALAQQSADDSAGEAIFSLLPDWASATASSPMGMGDLVNLKDAAIAFLKRIEGGDGSGLESELRQYVESCCTPGSKFDIGKSSGLFLLFRLVFELPDIVGASEIETFGGWYAAEDARGIKEKRESDDLHPSWPVYIARISNKLYIRADSNPKSIGAPPAYRIMDEYLYMRGKYKFRTAAYLRGLEFIFIADK